VWFGVANPDVAAARAAIVRYLERNTNAADSIDGIARWWLPAEQLRADRATVEQAIETLVADGLVEAAHLPDGTILYRRASAP